MTDISPLESIFFAALAKQAHTERQAFLDQACAGDDQLRQSVERMLAVEAEAGSFLEQPALNRRQTSAFPPVIECPGTHIGPYKLLQQIGEGGMGVVFMAEQTEPIQRTVALKVIKPGMDTRQVIARFEAELQAVAMMDHPNIAKVLDAGSTDSGRPYFVMELVKGVPITKFCDDKLLPIRPRLELFIQVCHAVQHAHQKGVIHRDIKPNNVLVTEYDNNAVPKVIDFGVAKAMAQRLTEQSMFTEFGQVLGTMEYMSPEQAKLNQLDIDTRSDIYSLGVLLYELLSGLTPFEGKRLHEAAFDEMLRIIREEEPPKPSTRLNTAPQLPSIAANRGLEPKKIGVVVTGELDWVVMKALEKDRNRRFETASGFAADVQRYLNDEPVHAGRPAAGHRLRKLVRRNKFAFLAAAAVAASLLFGLAVSTWLFFEEKAARQYAVSETAKATAVNNLLQQMLASANPDETKGADYTVRQLLDRYSEEFGSQLNRQPEVEAEIRATIGNAYRRLGLTSKAEPHLRAALKLRKQAFGSNHVEVAQSLLDYGWNVSECHDAVGAEEYVRQALAVFKQDRTQIAKTIETLSTLQLFLNSQMKYAEAEAVANEALELGRQHFPAGNANLADVLHRLAGPEIVLHHPQKAERLARESVAMHRKFHGDSHPETGYGLFHLGWALQEQQKYDEAEYSFREALVVFRKQYNESAPCVQSTLQHLRDVMTAKSDQAGLKRLEAEVAVRASELVARTDDALQRSIYRGNLHRDYGELDKAIIDYSAVLAVKPEMEEAWGLRADCYLRKNELTKAAADYTEAIKFNPHNQHYWHERGFAYMVLGEHEKSIRDHSRAIEINDQDAGQRLRRGTSYHALGELQKAKEDFSKAIELNPYYWENWFARAQLYGEQKQWEKAEDDLADAVKSCTANKPSERNDFAWALSTRLEPRLRKPEAALDQAKKAVEAASSDGGFWCTLGVAQYRNGNWQDAIDAFNKSIQTNGGGNSVAWYFLAMSTWQLGDKEQATIWYDKAVEWMDKNQPQNTELGRFRAEAEELLKTTDKK